MVWTILMLDKYITMHIRSAMGDSNYKKRDIVNLRKKLEKVEPIFTIDREESPLFNTMTTNK